MIIATDTYEDLGVGIRHTQSALSRNGVVWACYLAANGALRVVRVENGIASGPWTAAQTVDLSDRHCGPAMTMDSQGYLHLFYDGTGIPGIHPQGRYVRSLQPYDASAWTVPAAFAAELTYSFAGVIQVNGQDRLFVLYRSGGGSPYLAETRLVCSWTDTPLNPVWTTAPVWALDGDQAPFPQAMAVVGNRIHFAVSRTRPSASPAINCLYRYGYVRSDDCVNWLASNGQTVAAVQYPYIRENGAWHMAYGAPNGNAVDAQGRPLLWCARSVDQADLSAGNVSKPVTMQLWRHNGDGTENWTKLGEWPGYANQINGPLMIVGNKIRAWMSGWDEATQESWLDMLVSDDNGQTFAVVPFYLRRVQSPTSGSPKRRVVALVDGDASKVTVGVGGTIELLDSGLDTAPPQQPTAKAITLTLRNGLTAADVEIVCEAL